MKINRILYLLLGFIMLVPLSCTEDFLNLKNSKGITEGSLFKKEEDAVALVNGIYDTWHNFDFIIKSLYYQANFLSQDFKNFGADVFFETYEVPTTFDALGVCWRRCYQGIARANSALPIIAKMRAEKVLSDQLADRLTGEALFLRGAFYYYLASDFGGVPLVLETVTTGDGRTPRNTQDEVFAAVEVDMKAAAELLPWQQDLKDEDIGRATKGAALAYLGDAQMWLKKYGDAVATYNQIDGRYKLEEDYLKIHEFNNQNGKESIFEIQFITGSDMSWGATNDAQALTSFCLPNEIGTSGYAYADKRYYDSFEPGDLRKAPSVIGPGEVHPSPLVKISDYPNVKKNFGGINTLGTKEKPWTAGGRSGYYGVKTWRDPSASGFTGNNIYSSQNIIMMRYAQVLLSKAEALIRIGNSAGALDIINNQIRKRAGLAPAAGTDVMKILLDEYRHELAGEMSLWFLLRRSGEHLNYVKEKFNVIVPPGKDLMPIPQSEIAVNAKLVQNPGY